MPGIICCLTTSIRTVQADIEAEVFMKPGRLSLKTLIIRLSFHNAKRICHLNGSVAEYGKDITDHGTDVYMAANDWLQKHCTGGSHLNYRFRYTVTSYKGNHKSAKLPELAERIMNPVNCAVNTDGVCSTLSNVFSAITKEPLD